MKVVKWVCICIVALIFIVIGILIIIPQFVNIQKYKPYIEQKVSQVTGCPFSIGGELRISLFPSAGIAFSDLHLGNPPGFTEKDMLVIQSFEAKVKFMPLLSREVQVERFVMDGIKVVLEKNKKGKGNWEALGKPSATAPPTEAKTKGPESEESPLAGFPIKNLVADNIKINNSDLLWIDATTGERKEIGDLMLELRDVSLDNPVHIKFSASLNGKPIQVHGTVGPLGKLLEGKSIPLDISIEALRELALGVKGKVSDLLKQPAFDMVVELATFSPRKLAEALGQEFPVVTSDPAVFTKVNFKAAVKGDSKGVSLTDGTIELDQSRIAFSAQAKDFAEPDVMLKMSIDKIDVDRYLPPNLSKGPAGDKSSSDSPPPSTKKNKINYEPLRKSVVDVELQAGEVKVMGAHVRDTLIKIKGKNGMFTVDPVELKGYGGNINVRARLDVQADRPKAGVNIDMANIMIHPLLNDLMKKGFLEGTIKAEMALTMEGDDPNTIKKTLNGEGIIHVTDGSIVGINLINMMRNVKAAFKVDQETEKTKTDFSELLVPFTVSNGVVNISGARLDSPLLHVTATGSANLVTETLNMRLEPKMVATLRGQEDTKKRSEIMVPVLVTGTFSSPRFTPDLRGIVETQIQERIKIQQEKIEDILKEENVEEETDPTVDQEKTIKGVIKGLFGK